MACALLAQYKIHSVSAPRSPSLLVKVWRPEQVGEGRLRLLSLLKCLGLKCKCELVLCEGEPEECVMIQPRHVNSNTKRTLHRHIPGPALCEGGPEKCVMIQPSHINTAVPTGALQSPHGFFSCSVTKHR